MSRPLVFIATPLLFAAGVIDPAESKPANAPSPAPAKEKVVVYSGAALIDDTGGPPLPDMAIVTRGERIEAIVPQAELKIPPGAEVVDVKGQSVLPDFINSHEHLATPPDRKFAEAMMRRDLYSGVTAARCMGDDSRALADLARAWHVLEIPGPDLYYTGDLHRDCARPHAQRFLAAHFHVKVCFVDDPAPSTWKADPEWAEQCRRNLERDTMTHIKYGFAHVYKPVLDDASYRIFDSMKEYRDWCHERLPRYLGFRIAHHAAKQIPTPASG